jgi:hypothetical protein
VRLAGWMVLSWCFCTVIPHAGRSVRVLSLFFVANDYTIHGSCRPVEVISLTFDIRDPDLAMSSTSASIAPKSHLAKNSHLVNLFCAKMQKLPALNRMFITSAWLQSIIYGMHHLCNVQIQG